MASIISISSKTQQSYSSIGDESDKNYVIHSLVDDWMIDINYPIIAKGNIIEGIEAKE